MADPPHLDGCDDHDVVVDVFIVVAVVALVFVGSGGGCGGVATVPVVRP